MKKASKLLWVLLPLAMTILMFSACRTDGPEDEDVGGWKNPSKITTAWQTFYLKSVDDSRPGNTKDLSGLQRWHFHNNTYDAPIGLEIQKIFVSPTLPADGAAPNTLPSGAQIVVDFTQGTSWNVSTIDAPFTEIQGTANTAGDPLIWTIADGKATTGERNDTVYEYLGNVSSALFVDTVYIGFVMRNVSATATAETIRMGGDGATLQAKGIITIAEWFALDYEIETPPPEETDDRDILNDWVTAYYETKENPQALEFHVNNGSVVIQKIFVNDIRDEAGATVLFDFTDDPAYDGDNFWWGADSLDDFISGGSYVLESDGDYVGAGRFGSGLLQDAVYIGFVIKSEDGLGDTRIRLGKGDPFEEIEVIRFSALYK